METSSSSLCIESPYNKLFNHYEYFNSVQTSLLPHLLNTNNSVVLSAPTGSGKTIAFEFAIVRLLQQRQVDEFPPKAIYVAPIKALCSERYNDWKRRFACLGIICKQITGDTEYMDSRLADDIQLVVTTPEKWDSITRRWQEYESFMRCVGLFMIDEVHLLNEDKRGPILEVIVARMKTIAGNVSPKKEIRFLIASATMRNVHDLAAWIKSGSETEVTELVYSDTQRPIPLEKYVIGVNSKQTGFRFDISLNYKLPEILRKYAEQRATLVFCNSRKSTEMAALVLEKYTMIFVLSEQQKSYLTQLSERVRDGKLRRLFGRGIAYHHAGMSYEERHLVEESFRNGHLMLLFCTNTLAMGVNLPAHLVVVKSTESYNGGTLTEYTESTLIQMIGRAGRPQYDTKGVAVILTQSKNVHKYEQLVNGVLPFESQLHKQLAEHLNSEIALNSIKNLKNAMNWIHSTFLYVRAVQNPKLYGLDTKSDNDFIERKLEELCLLQINALHAAGLITKNMSDNGDLTVQTTAYGQLMSKYYICFDTMKLFRQLRGNETILELLKVIVCCKEFSDFTLRVSEKRDLNALNNCPIRFPITGRIRNKEDKILCLMQAIFGNYTINVPALAQEAMKMIRIGDRVAKCLLEYMRLYRRESHDQFSTDGNVCGCCCYKALLHTVTIAKCFHAKLWENSEYAAKQLRKIGAVYSSLLANAGKKTLKSIAMTDARSIEQILMKSPPFGNEVLEQLLNNYPEFTIEFKRLNVEMLQIYVRQVNELYRPGNINSINLMLIVGDTANNLLFYNEQIGDMLRLSQSFERTIKILDATAEAIYAHVIHATIVGVDCEATFQLNEPRTPSTKITVTPKQTVSKTKNRVDGGAKKRKATTNDTHIGKDIGVNQSVTSLKGLSQFVYKKLKLSSANTLNDIESLHVKQQLDATVHSDKLDNTLIQTKVTKYYNTVRHYNDRRASSKDLFDGESSLAYERHKTLKYRNATSDIDPTTNSLIGSIKEPTINYASGGSNVEITDDISSTAATNKVGIIPATQLDTSLANTQNLQIETNPVRYTQQQQQPQPQSQQEQQLCSDFVEFSNTECNSFFRDSFNTNNHNKLSYFASHQLDMNISAISRRRSFSDQGDNSSRNDSNIQIDRSCILLTENSYNVKSSRESNLSDLRQHHAVQYAHRLCPSTESCLLENILPAQETATFKLCLNVNDSTMAADCANAALDNTIGSNNSEQHLLFFYQLSLTFSKLPPSQRNFKSFKLIHQQMNIRHETEKGPKRLTIAQTLPKDFCRRHELCDIDDSNIENDNVMLQTKRPSARPQYNPYRLQLFQETTLAAELSPRRVSRINRDIMKTVLKQKCKRMLCNNGNNRTHQVSQQAVLTKDIDTSSSRSSCSSLNLLTDVSSNSSEAFATFEEYFKSFIASTEK